MNKVWIVIIFISLSFGLLTNNINEMIKSLFEIPLQTINVILKIFSSLIIYNGMFNILVKSNILMKLFKPIYIIVKRLFKNLDDDVLYLICFSVVSNLLGLGALNTTLSIKIIKQIKIKKHLFLYLLLCTSSLCIMPLSLLSIRSSFNAKINTIFIFIIFISSFISTLLSIVFVKLFLNVNEDDLI